jgi:hypothetical protein
MSTFPIYPYALVREAAAGGMSTDALMSRMITDLAELQRRAASDLEVERPLITVLGEVLHELKIVEASRYPGVLEASGWIMPAEVA